MTVRSSREERQLRRAARIYGVQSWYRDIRGERQAAKPEALVACLRAMGASMENIAEAEVALSERRRQFWERLVEPVAVAWDGAHPGLVLRLPASALGERAAVTLHLEDGEERTWTQELADAAVLLEADVSGTRYVAVQLKIPGVLPWGYHSIRVEASGGLGSSTIISAPRRAYESPGGTPRTWGVFLPLYALWTERSWGCGDFTDLESLMAWTGELGGRVVATLPYLAAFLRSPLDPSPYAPASRLFWNELYVDPRRAHELSVSQAARSLLDSADTRAEIERLSARTHVDHAGSMALKRRVLEGLAHSFFSGSGPEDEGYKRYLAREPAPEDYARFRAAGDLEGKSWHVWPERLKAGDLRPGDWREEDFRYHLYVQWLATRQLEEVAQEARRRDQRIYLDLPLGVHSDSYDVWRERNSFVLGAAAGAPPDSFFTGGQNWGFPPLHPEGIREDGYRYFRASLRHHLQQAGLLRIDHVMGLHRLFWVPHGIPTRDGVYIRYHAAELYAILSLESHRHRTWIVGENLGIVPAYVNASMRRHNIKRMYVAQYAVRPHAQEALPAVPAGAVASLNTHDMPPWRAFWEAHDVEQRVKLGLLEDRAAPAERARRSSMRKALAAFLAERGYLPAPTEDLLNLLHGTLRYLGDSAASVVLLNLEDLWLEPDPQNVPGTVREHANWQRRARYSFPEFSRMPQVLAPLMELAARRTTGEDRTAPASNPSTVASPTTARSR